jgi:hypothetical protein
MIVASYDLETHAIQPGLLAPPIVIGSTCTSKPGTERVLSREEALETIIAYLKDPDVTISGANIAYDFGCVAAHDPRLLPLIFKAYAEHRVYDVQVAMALDFIANGYMRDGGIIDPRTGSFLVNGKGIKTKRFSLETCVDLMLGRKDAKANDFWRARYAILERVPRQFWPTDAEQYPKDDARNTQEVTEAQLAKPLRNLLRLPEEVETAFALHLGAVWGLRTDAERVRVLEEKTEKAHAALIERYTSVGFIRENGSQDTAAVKRSVALAYGASGVCERCKGTGKVRKPKQTPCRGEKRKGRYQGCLIPHAHCFTCENTSEVTVFGNEVICQAKEGGCDGTGLDLETAPTLPRADAGGISTARDTLEESGDDELSDYGANECEKIRDTYLPELKKGIHKPINLRPNVLVASTRVSYDGLWQLFPREGGVRECVVARPGRVFGSTDYGALELCTLAQTCIWVCGYSNMADVINESGKPGLLHNAFGASMMGISLVEFNRLIDAKDKTAKDYRQASKAANFGFGGGMGAAKLVIAKRKRNEGSTIGPDGRKYSGIRFCILLSGAHECGSTKITEWKRRTYPPMCKTCVEVVERELRPAWFAKWPEVKEYHNWCSATIEDSGEIPALHPAGWPQFVRGGVEFSAAANNGFQHLAARGAKNALRQVTREAYCDESSALYRARLRVPMFVHDELFTEMDEGLAHEAGPRVAEIMIKAMRELVPDVAVTADTALMKYWYKEAEPVYKDGRLVVWEPKAKG